MHLQIVVLNSYCKSRAFTTLLLMQKIVTVIASREQKIGVKALSYRLYMLILDCSIGLLNQKSLANQKSHMFRT